MRYSAESQALHLIHLLRYIMRVKTTASVLSRAWEFRHLFSTIYVYREARKEPVAFDVFPEFQDEVPLQVDGMRLMERVGLVEDFEETELVRLADDAPDGYDLWIWVDTPTLAVQTDDEDMYLTIKEYFDHTSELAFRGFYF